MESSKFGNVSVYKYINNQTSPIFRAKCFPIHREILLNQTEIRLYLTVSD